MNFSILLTVSTCRELLHSWSFKNRPIIWETLLSKLKSLNFKETYYGNFTETTKLNPEEKPVLSNWCVFFSRHNWLKLKENTVCKNKNYSKKLFFESRFMFFINQAWCIKVEQCAKKWNNWYFFRDFQTFLGTLIFMVKNKPLLAKIGT